MEIESRRLLVRYSGELTTKATQTRRRFVSRLVSNLQETLRASETPGRVERTHDRIYVELARAEDAPTALAALARVFGIQSVARVEARPWSRLEDVVAAGVELFADQVAGRRFAVRARRVGNRNAFSIRHQDVEQALGAALLPRAAGVDLGAPEVTARIELTPDEAFYELDAADGPGGLPLGVEGRAVALASGGFDSAVAAWLMLKRGVSIDYVFCNLGGRSHQLEALRVLAHLADLWHHGVRPRLHAVDFDAVSRDLQDAVAQRYWQVVLKRLMLRAAEQVARDRDADAIVTGDAVGQVSSQTLRNVAVISEATRVPILRPLVGFNKDEILAIARSIGTYELSAQVGEYCAMVPSKPATAATLAAIHAEEAHLDPSVLERAVAERSVFDLRELDLASLETPGLEATEIRPGDAVLDLRSKAAYAGWHHPDAMFLDFASALRAYPSLPKGRRYILYCEFGLKSAHLAELMRAEGHDALHFAKGLGDLLAWCRANGVPTPETP